MKKGILSFAVLFLLVFSVNAQMDNLANMSAKWMRTNVRNATLDGGGDMVNYNPAGLAMLSDGIYVSLSNQTMFRHPEHSFNFLNTDLSYEQDGCDPFLPMFYAAWKKNRIAISSGVYITGGGATVNYPDGSINTIMMGYSISPGNQITNQSLKASSYYLTVPLNFSYAINDKLSLSAGARFVRGINKTEAEIAYSSVVFDVDYKSNANGWGGIIGIDYKPCNRLNIALHYETKVKLEFEAKDNKGSMSLEADGTKSKRDLPAVLSSGIAYHISDKLIAETDFNYYFQKRADWGQLTDPTSGEVVDASDAAGNCYTANLGFRYLLNDKLELSAGCSYTHFNYDNIELYYTKMGLYEALKYNNLNVGFGAGYYITKNIQLDLGFGRTFWKDKTVNSLSAQKALGTEFPVNLTDKSYVLAIGVDLRF